MVFPLGCGSSLGQLGWCSNGEDNSTNVQVGSRGLCHLPQRVFDPLLHVARCGGDGGEVTQRSERFANRPYGGGMAPLLPGLSGVTPTRPVLLRCQKCNAFLMSLWSRGEGVRLRSNKSMRGLIWLLN